MIGHRITKTAASYADLAHLSQSFDFNGIINVCFTAHVCFVRATCSLLIVCILSFLSSWYYTLLMTMLCNKYSETAEILIEPVESNSLQMLF